jgi:hypothetical protein
MEITITIESTEFARIRSAAEDACLAAIAEPIKCCANFGDLHCTEVIRCIRDDGDSWWLVRIEEASPGDSVLCKYVHDKLSAQGITAEVEIEW